MEHNRSTDLYVDPDSRPSKRIRTTNATQNGPKTSSDEYTVGWICALPLEMAAAKGMLDQVHPDLSQQDPADHNNYILGQIQGHNVVIACLPAGIYGTITAATVAKDLLRTFKSIRFGLLVGIGGGAPSRTNDIRLGDVVVSQPTGTCGGAIQYDRGKTVQDGEFQRKGSLSSPPQVLLTALGRLQAEHMTEDSKIPQYLAELVQKSPKRMKKRFSYQGPSNDCLYQAEYEHVGQDLVCEQCDQAHIVQRHARDDIEPLVHYGIIASGNQVIKHGNTRDRLARELGALCFEMEAAGLQDFPCLVIRGICDYSDSHKNKKWQEYAAATAAAFTKELLSVIRPNKVLEEKPIQQLISLTEKHLQVSADHCDISFTQLSEQKRTNQILEDRPIHLPSVEEARYGSADFDNSPKCEKGTRAGILQKISQWASEYTAKPFFWLTGPAGTGKSSIARTFAESFESDERLVAGYFFKRGEQGRNDIARLLPTVAAQLIDKKIPGFKDCLWKSLNGLDKDAVERKGLKFQFEQLLLQPLKDLPPSSTFKSTKVVIIIDALDECECTNDQLSTVLNLLCKLETLSTIRVRVMLTSRLISGVTHVFKDFQQKKMVQSLNLHRDFSNETKADVRTFLQARFAIIKEASLVLQEPWPTPQDLDYLVHLTTDPEPLFIYASTLCCFIYDEEHAEPPDIRLKNWLLQCGSKKSQLDEMYTPIFKMAFSGKTKAQQDQLLQFLGAVVTLANPLSAASLASLLNLSASNIIWWLRRLHAVLDIPTDPYHPIRPLHKSFSDFLLRQGDSGPGDYRVDAKETHTTLAAKCIQRMKDGLKRDICNIQKPDMLRDEIDKQVIDEHIPADLQYACLYWIYHLQQCEEPLGDEVGVFLKMHLLYWLEVLALLSKVSVGAAAINQLSNMCQQRSKKPIELSEFVKDASKVIGSFGSMIEQTPLQVYGALILFSPVSSRVRQRCWDQRLPNLPRIYGVISDWDALRQTLEGHTDPVWEVTFSPDGQVVASASEDETVRLWDVATGALRQTLKGHMDCVTAVAFSPDGQVVASASEDKTVRLWGVATGALRQTLEGYTSYIYAVAFSPDGQVVASASRDRTVQLWDVATGALRQTLEGHISYIYAVAFSSDGQVVASASWDATVRLWDVATGALQQTLKGHMDYVTAVAFSPDGQVVASASDDETVRLWDVATGALQQTLKGHTDCVTAVSFSPDGQVVASASWDETVRLWDAATGALRQTLDMGFTRYVTFDPCSNTRLCTDFGIVDLVAGSLVGESHSPEETPLSPVICGFGISPDKTWIMEGKEKIIWLPNEYRPTASATRGSVLSFGCSLGRVFHVTTTRKCP